MRAIQKVHLLLILALFVGTHLSASPLRDTVSDVFQELLDIGKHSISSSQEIQFKFDNTIDHLKIKQVKWEGNHRRLLEHMFYNVHHHYLKTFKKYQTFEQLMLNGNYNCLTGTALYALILEELGYKYDIIETTYHIFIIVKTQTGRFLIESTDPFSGFEYNDDIINERLQAIRDSELKRHNKSVYNYKVSLFKNVGLMDLVGLQFYNQAINAFNNKEFINAAVYLDQASNYYRSERYLEFFQLIVANIIKDPELYREFSKNYRYMNILATL